MTGNTRSVAKPRPTLANVGRRPITSIMAAVLAHLALLMAAAILLRSQSRTQVAPSLLALALSAAAILLAVPVGLRGLRRGESRAWWLVTPAFGLVLVGALRDTWSRSDPSLSLAAIATTAAGASLALSCGGSVFALHAGWGARDFRVERAVLPLLVGLGGLGFIAIAGLGRAASLVYALPAAFLGVLGVGILAGVVVKPHEPDEETTPSSAVLVAWISLAAIALASFAAGAVGLASHLKDGTAVALAVCRRAMLLSWLVSIPVVAAAVAGIGLRLGELGTALKATRLDFVGTVGLLLAAFTIERVETRAAFTQVALAANRERAPEVARVRPPPRSRPPSSAPKLEAIAPPPSASAPLEEAAPELPSTLAERASIRIGRPVIKGRIDDTEIMARLERGVDRWQNCYDQLPLPRPAVRATLFFYLDADGSVTRAELRDSNAEAKLEKCIILQLYRSGFSNPQGQSVSVFVPIEFIPDE